MKILTNYLKLFSLSLKPVSYFSTSTMGKFGKNRIPNRWEMYSNVGAVVEGTQFIAFKVPLSFDSVWNLTELGQAVPSLKHIVDLTNTDRYYKAGDCEELGWSYVKIKMPGHGTLPSQNCVEKFYSAVQSAEQTGGLIGVHCTHGLNRTGYLISRFLIEKKDWQPQRAIAAFDLARGHKQERENYLEHLKSKGWERPAEREVRGGGHSGGHSSGTQANNRRNFSTSAKHDRRSEHQPSHPYCRSNSYSNSHNHSYSNSHNHSHNYSQQQQYYYPLPCNSDHPPNNSQPFSTSHFSHQPQGHRPPRRHRGDQRSERENRRDQREYDEGYYSARRENYRGHSNSYGRAREADAGWRRGEGRGSERENWRDQREYDGYDGYYDGLL